MDKTTILFRRSLTFRSSRFRPEINLDLDNRSFSLGEAEALLGTTLRVMKPPHNLVRSGTAGVVSTYKLLFDQIVLQVKWPDGKHDYYTKREVLTELARVS